MIERFVELAQKHAPELRATSVGQGEACEVKGYYFETSDDTDHRNIGAAQFTITLLEYLKGLDWEDMDEIAYLTLDSKLSKPWRTLTTESVMQACIDVWEVME